MELLRQQPLDKVNMEDITNNLINYGKDRIPTNVKDNAYKQIKEFLEDNVSYKAFISK